MILNRRHMKKTMQQRADALGLSVDVLKKMKVKGVNIDDPKAIKDHQNTQRLRVQSTKKNAKDDSEESSIGAAMTIEDIDAIINNPASDYSQIRTAKERLASLTASQKLRRELAESFSADEVKERDTRIASAVRMAMMRFETDMPGQCEGLTASKMKVVIRVMITQLLTDLSDAQSPFWAEVEKVKKAKDAKNE